MFPLSLSGPAAFLCSPDFLGFFFLFFSFLIKGILFQSCWVIWHRFFISAKGFSFQAINISQTEGRVGGRPRE